MSCVRRSAGNRFLYRHHGVKTGMTILLALSMTFALSACGDNYSSSGSEYAAKDAHIQGQFQGAGASTQTSAMEAWIAGYQSGNRQVQIAYNPTGSGAGVAAFLNKATIWSGSDVPLNDAQVEKSAVACAPNKAIEVPVYISPVAIAYHLQGVQIQDRAAGESSASSNTSSNDSSGDPSNLSSRPLINLSPETVARIFDGHITWWDDQAITGQNEHLTLPHTSITVVRRSDHSGTTAEFTEYLHQASNGEWSYKVSEAWPNAVGQAAKGTDGIVTTMNQADGTIGYVDAAQIGTLGSVALKVADKYVPFSSSAASLLVDQSKTQLSEDGYRLKVDVNFATKDSNTYPLVLVSYALTCPSYADSTKATFVRSWLQYIVSPQGQQYASENAGSVPMGDALREKVLNVIASIH